MYFREEGERQPAVVNSKRTKQKKEHNSKGKQATNKGTQKQGTESKAEMKC